MGDTNVGLNALVIAAYDARAIAIATANRIKSAATLGNAQARAIAAGGARATRNYNPQIFRTIALELIGPVQSNANPTNPAGPPPSASTSALERKAKLTFDVAGASADGYAQRISITSPARQVVHQTVLGNYVDEWGVGVGSLEVDVIVIYGASEGTGANIQSFFDLLNKAKKTTPLDGTPPLILRYHDYTLQRSYIITQNSLSFEESAERQNHARLTISADILFDYGTSDASTPTQTTVAPVSPAVLKAALGSGATSAT
jgi:hypothetical protein